MLAELSDFDNSISEFVLLEAVGAWGNAQVAGQHFVGGSVDEVGLCVEKVLEFVFCFHLFNAGAGFALGIIFFKDDGAVEVEFGEACVCVVELLTADGVSEAGFQGFDGFKGRFLFEEAFYGDDDIAFLHEPGGSFFSFFVSDAADEAFFDEVDAVGDVTGVKDGGFLFECCGVEEALEVGAEIGGEGGNGVEEVEEGVHEVRFE